MLTHGSLFSGVGGFDLGFEAAGFRTAFQVEWDKHCQQVLGYHWPDVPRWADVSEVSGAELPPVDVISYGFPCQDLSVAGKRAGLDGSRSHLFFEAVRIITEMREATDGRYPTWAVAENVAGLLNADGGHAMGRVVDELADAGAVVIEWTLLDAQYFGVPQRRRRVFIASCFNPATAQRCPDPLFPVGSGSSRDTQTSKEPRQDVTEDVGGGSAFGSGSIGGYKEGTGTLRASGGDLGGGSEILVTDVVGPLTTHMGSPRGTETTDSHHVVPVVFDPSRCEGNGMAAAIPIQDGREMDKHQNGLGVGDTGDPAYTLDTTGGQAVAQPLMFHQNQRNEVRTTDISTALGTGGGKPGQGYPAVMLSDLAVRRLTPVECERLMGWPDDHTLHRADGKMNADSTRYKMCGNGVVAPVARWVAKHLAATMEQR